MVPAMKLRTITVIVPLLQPLTCLSIAEAPDRFQRLTGAQIQARFAGTEFTDDVHWRDRFERDGRLNSQSMGKAATGKWWIKNDELCIDRGKDSGGCYQVWMAGRKVEFRREGLDAPVLDGTLQKPAR
jgi:hypothetical protein